MTQQNLNLYQFYTVNENRYKENMMSMNHKQTTINDSKRVFQEVSQNITQKQKNQSQQQQNHKKTSNGNKQLDIKYFFKTRNRKEQQQQNEQMRNRLDESLEDMFVMTNQNQTQNECLIKPYIKDVLEYIQSIEHNYIAQTDRFIEIQDKVDLKMRTILIDWLIQVHTEFNLLPQTLFLTINLIDRFICLQKVEMNQFQLLGVAALFMSSKYEEIYPPQLVNYSIVTNNSVSIQEILFMESEIIRVLGYTMNMPSCYRFYEIFTMYSGLGILDSERKDDNKQYKTEKGLGYEEHQRRKALMLGRYLIELCLFNFNLQSLKPSLIAAACIYSVNKIYKRQLAWSLQMQQITGYTEQQVRKPAKVVMDNIKENQEKSIHKRLISKYQNERYEKTGNTHFIYNTPNRS